MFHDSFPHVSMFLCILMLYFSGTVPMVKHQPSDTIYNSTLAKILVEYASAVRALTFFILIF
jgi:hypothetical protein